MHKRLAEVLVGYSTEVRQGDTVRIESYDTSALPVMRETFGAALRAGGHPVANLVLEETEGILYNEGGTTSSTGSRPTSGGTSNTGTCGSSSTP